MAHPSDSSYVIFHPENLGLKDVPSIILSRIPTGIVETNHYPTLFSRRTLSFDVGLKLSITLIFQKFLIWLHHSFYSCGDKIEFFLNFIQLNGGMFQSVFRYCTGSSETVWPKRDEANYRSMAALIDGRDDLYKVSTIFNQIPDTMDSITEKNPLELCCMASKVAYENENYVKNVVSNKWKAHFVGFYNFRNNGSDTQAFICCDRRENAQRIVLAFRGTEFLNWKDWATDIDMSWMSMGEMGRVHAGFMKALGFDIHTSWTKNYNGTHTPAYYSLRDTLKTLLQENKGAELLITGHSLGGALAILFPAILLFHQEHDLMSSLSGVYTFGQPRVGDKKFGKFMEAKLNERYHRVVFRYDIVPRVPFDIPPICEFAHVGEYIYYLSWYKGQVMSKEVNPNYFDPRFALSKRWNACLDFFRAVGKWNDSDFEETWPSILLRIIGIPVCPGVASHSVREYFNGARLAKITISKPHY